MHKRHIFTVLKITKLAAMDKRHSSNDSNNKTGFLKQKNCLGYEKTSLSFSCIDNPQ